ncbi:MAG: GNAT family N-acetyltransferase [Gammaproteobacteria bacterium]|nr:GNAT family N-acetyltransferase [Gammaproteobacteria bacterium]
MNVTLTQPETDKDFQQYYNLRWRILRKPWGKTEGSERDITDINCYHIMAVINGDVAGVARLEFTDNGFSQLRYMAVDDIYQGKGVGRSILDHMEQYSKDNNARELFLHARQNALGFYEKSGYQITEKSYLLFDSIQHYKMVKIL